MDSRLSLRPDTTDEFVRAAASWLQAHPESASLEIRFEVASVSDGRVERLDFAED